MTEQELQNIKKRFSIIGNNEQLNDAIAKAVQIASTDLPVLITGESGVGKETFPKIIHDFSSRRHNKLIIVNCGAIPEGTIDSELFGHEKGSFTGALAERKGYFEVANGGTIFLDEVGELPLPTQARLLRVLQYGEYYRVGSSDIKKTDVRVIAATNMNLLEAIKNGKFREDLYYRLNGVPISIPPLRERKEDIYPLFRKFANDFAEKYSRPAIQLQENAKTTLSSYYWQGNIRQLKNVAEQISAVETTTDISDDTLRKYLPDESASRLPSVVTSGQSASDNNFVNVGVLYKFLLEMKQELELLKTEIGELKIKTQNLEGEAQDWNEALIYNEPAAPATQVKTEKGKKKKKEEKSETEEMSEGRTVSDVEKELIINVLEKYNGKRSLAAKELGIAERTLYRKIIEYGLK